MSKRVLIIGLDGVTSDLIGAWMKGRKLPNLQKLCSEGASGKLRSTIPVNSAVAWSAFITGKNPGNNNVFDFYYRSPDSYSIRFINSHSRKASSFWKIIGDSGKRVGIINVPVTFPPEEVNGFLISGMMSPEANQRIFYPRQLYDELGSFLAGYKIKVFGKEHVRKGKYEELRDAIVKNEEIRYRLTKHLLTSESWDLFCVVFTGTDHMSHYFWHFMDSNHPLYDRTNAEYFGNAILEMYQKVDEYVGELLTCLDEDASVIVLSDHGHGPNKDVAVYLNNWLAQEGYLTFRDGGKGKQRARGMRDPLRRSLRLARKHMPRKLKNKVRAISWLRSYAESFYRMGDIDWANTVAFSDEVRETIWINLKGRFPLGKVHEGREYNQLRDEIVQKIKQFSDPYTGERIFADAIKREDLYSGRFVDLGPDILLYQEENSYNYVLRSSNAISQRVPAKRFTKDDLGNHGAMVASHRINGVLFLRGEAVEQNKTLLGAEIIDIAPTVFYLMGLPIPDDLDGKLLTQAMRPDHIQLNPPQYEHRESADHRQEKFAYSQTEEEEIADQLRALGYMD